MSASGLVVPVNVVAFCVGSADAQGPTSSFSGATTSFIGITTETEPFLGSTASISFSESALNPLQEGTHLHWALPDSLTKATLEGNKHTFPAVPNRWIVTRVAIDVENGAPIAQTKSWVVQSDDLTVAPGSEFAVTLPVKDGANQSFRFVGSFSDFDCDWVSTPSQMANLAGAELGATSSGVVSFASYYPDCRSVFGFCDTTTPASPNLSYVVTGWFDRPSNDPLNGGLTLKQIEADFGWTFTDMGVNPNYTLYSGFVQGVDWNSTNSYVDTLPEIEATGALGNSPAEAMSAFFAGPGSSTLEQLLNVLQLGLLKSYATSDPDAGADLHETLHTNEFGGSSAGTCFVIVPKVDGGGNSNENRDLPLILAGALNQLNICQQQYDLCDFTQRSFRQRLFTNWYRIFTVSDDENTAAMLKASHQYGNWSALSTAWADLQTARDAQVQKVSAMLDPTQILKAVPAERYWQPADPTILLSAPELAFPRRYGGDGDFSARGTLACRLTDQTISAIDVDGHSLDATAFANLLPTPNHLPDTDAFVALVLEACLLTVPMAAAISGRPKSDLEQALKQFLLGETQTLYTGTGSAPSPLAMEIWDGNPWLPVFLEWNVSYLPLLATQDTLGKEMFSYSPTFFTANYSIDPNAGGAISYTPNGPGSIQIDPSTASFTQTYAGQTILSPSPAQHFVAQIQSYLASAPADLTLENILAELKANNYLTQPLSGFTNSLVLRDQGLRLNISAPPRSTYGQLTALIAPIVGDQNTFRPNFYESFNPIRAGYAQISSLTAIDVFGQRRQINLSSLGMASSMITTVNQKIVENVAFLPPRVSQPSRLLFRWISADSKGSVEMNTHPATSPICGWLLPNHLDEGFFLYGQQGNPLGSLNLNGDASKVMWQSAPGNNATIGEGIEAFMQNQNPQLAAIAISLANSTPEYFNAFFRTVDSMHGTIVPDDLHTNSGLSVLVGRPVAIAQASLRLEVAGEPALDLTQSYFATDEGTSDGDAGMVGVKFPVVLGDLAQLNDGLIGYFLAGNAGYDLDTFYTQSPGVMPGSSGVVAPTEDTLTVVGTPAFGSPQPPDLSGSTQLVLMLIDPRASVHATTGVLPTLSIAIPPDMVSNALSNLEMSFLIAPVLRGDSELVLPVPKESGFAVSWLEQESIGDGRIDWSVDGDLGSAGGKIAWQYSPQSVIEGWLRYTPMLLEFELLNQKNVPTVVSGTPNDLQLVVTNRSKRKLTLSPGQLVREGKLNEGSVFYFHFAMLVSQSDIPNIVPTSNGWQFLALNDAQYGAYWAAAPTQSLALADGDSIHIDISNVIPATQEAQTQVYFDYYNCGGIVDGVFSEILTVVSSTATTSRTP